MAMTDQRNLGGVNKEAENKRLYKMMTGNSLISLCSGQEQGHKGHVQGKQRCREILSGLALGFLLSSHPQPSHEQQRLPSSQSRLFGIVLSL